MIELLLTALGLGVAGLDPAGALIAVGALGAGARERHVAAYGVVVFFGTVALGTALSLALGPRLAGIDRVALIPGGLTGAFAEAALGLGLVAWGAVRAWRPATRAPKPRSVRGTGLVYLIAVGALFSLSAVPDPTFVSLVVIAGRDGSFWSISIAHAVWVLISQAPLAALLATMGYGKHRRFTVRFQSWWARIRSTVGRVVTGAVLLVGAFFLLDAGWWFVTGEFLIPG